MVEVEAKVAISKNEYSALRKKLSELASPCGERISADSYYERSEPIHIRIRQTGDNNIFTIKRRQTIKGIESNLELEWGIHEIKEWRRLLKKLKLVPLVKKFKKSLLFRLKGFHIELNYVRHLGHFLEIERIVRLEADIPKAKRELIALYHELGYSQERFEPRPYLQLLENV